MSRSHVRVRPAELADIPELVSLLQSTELPLAACGTRQFHAETMSHLPERFAALLADAERTALVAVEEGTEDVVGLILLSDEEVGAVVPMPTLTVSNLVVAAGHRRRGVGRALLAAAVHVADQRGIEQVVASAVTGSRDANRYLARLGFAPLVVRRIAPTATLRRSLGLADGGDRIALLRRVRGGRAGRSGYAARRA